MSTMYVFHLFCVTANRSLCFQCVRLRLCTLFYFGRNGKMPDYEKMYFELLNKTERVVRILTEYQREIADMYAEAILEEGEEE